MTPNLRALIFDMDGVIANTIGLHYQAWKRLSEEERIPLTDQQNRQMQGLPRPESLKVFLNGRALSAETAQAWMERKNSYFHELLQGLTPRDCLPGAAELIAQGRAAGLKIGLGSSSQNVQRVLDKLKLRAAFDVIADGATVARNKPAPDIYLWVAEKLGVTPGEAVIFEDSDAGIQAALAGGFWVVGVGNEYETAPHVAVNTLTEVQLSHLPGRLKKR